MAASGYGKVSASGQKPRREGDFAHLPAREAYLAAFIDRLPDGAAIDTKTLAREQPLYGQQAVRSALSRLSAAGHLCRILVNAGGRRIRWVYRTYFSRTARDDGWWSRFLAGKGSDASPSSLLEKEIQPKEEPRQSRPVRSAAYEALAGLGRADGRMALSASECQELEGLAAEWLACGATAGHLTTALTAGLPETVHCAGALARKRLIAKMPPATVRPPERSVQPVRVVRRMLECANCGVPGSLEALPGGLCRVCRGDVPEMFRNGPDADGVRSRVEGIRRAIRSMASGVTTPERCTPGTGRH
ncbi:hypothetical protein GXW82_39145 [Streptacidiphilus sp. 4-A2]|nr:hypothetical protein [Streptacidiphilus sp. 4-A2]